MAPMASSDPEVKTCSKTCLNNYETLKKQYDDLLAKQLQTKFEAATYKRGLIQNIGKGLKDLDQLVRRVSTIKKKKQTKPEFEGYGLRANKSVCENSSNETKKNSDAPLIEEWVSDNEDEVESPVVVEKKTVVPTIPKVDVVRPKQQEKPVRKNKLGFDHLQYTCKHKRHVNGQREEKPVWKNTRRVNDHYSTRMTHSNPRRNMIPQAVLMRSGIKAVNTAKPKDAHNAVKRNRFNTVKASACWVWMPKNRVIDHTAGYKVTTAGSRLLLLVKKLMLLAQVNAVRHNLMLID
ncbi:hypothetical protein Tco_1036400 [Tanacetum coccineum]